MQHRQGVSHCGIEELDYLLQDIEKKLADTPTKPDHETSSQTTLLQMEARAILAEISAYFPIPPQKSSFSFNYSFRKLFSNDIEAEYPKIIIKAALMQMQLEYPKDGPHQSKISDVLKIINQGNNSNKEILDSIDKAREGTKFGRANAGLKMIANAIKDGLPINGEQLAQRMSDHDPSKRNIFKRIFD